MEEITSVILITTFGLIFQVLPLPLVIYVCIRLVKNTLTQ